MILTTATAGPALAQLCGPTDDPCLVSTDVNVPAGTTIDLGSRDLVIAASRTITSQGAGTLTINAGDITFAAGAKIVAPGALGSGGLVTLQAAGAFVMQTGSRIDTTGGSAGDINITADHAQLGGELQAVATTRGGFGGYVTIITTGDLSIGGTGMDLTGGDRDGFGGSLDTFVGGNIDVTAPIDAKGGDGGDISFDAQGNVVIHPGADLTNIATTPLGDGGFVDMSAVGLLSIQAAIFNRGAGDLLEGAGSGGDIDLSAGSIQITAPIDTDGPGPDGDGGFLDVFADTNITITGSINASGAAEGVGGDIFIEARGNISLGSGIDVTGGSGGGSFDATTPGDVTLTASSAIDVGATPGLAVLGFGGDVYLQGCAVTLAGTIDAVGFGPPGTVKAVAGNLLTASGTITAPGGVTFQYGTTAPVIMPSAVITPAPLLVQDTSIPCCVNCPTTTSTSTSTTTTTSTSLPTTTTTSSVPTTSVSTTSSSSSSSSSSTSSITSSTAISSSTSTTIPGSCLDEPLQGYPAVDCAVTLLQDMVSAQDEIALGGHKSARRLAGKVAKTQALVDKSQTSAKAAKLLVKAEKKVISFQTQITKLQAQAKIADPLASELLDLSGEVSARIDGVLTPAN